jgi:hypothetical protein
MADTDNAADAAARLEAALERIARAASRPPAVEYITDQATGEREQHTAELAARLDALIAELRDALTNKA